MVSSFSLISCGHGGQKKDIRSVADRQQPEIVLPKNNRVTIFFKDIDKRTKEANLPNLRRLLLSEDDLEVRVWAVASYYGEDAVVLRRTAKQWSALYVEGFTKDPNVRKIHVKSLGPPRSGNRYGKNSLTAAC
jgi:hypothetical protein